MNVKINKKFEVYLLLFLLTVGFILRLYRFNNPIADWHSWRQSDTSAVSRTFVEEGFDVLHPKYEDLSNVPSGLDNPNGYRFVEFPIYNLFQAGFYKYIGVITLEEWGRLVTIFASLFSAIFLFLIIKKRFGKLTAYLTAGFFLFLPFNIYYSRTILPDPSMVMASLGGIYFFQRWLENDIKLKASNIKYWRFFVISLIFTTVALLLKPYALFFTLPMVYMAFEKFKLKTFIKWQLWLYLIISVIPLALWREWMTQFPAGIPNSEWLFNSNHIRFRPAFFRWLFYERLTKLILGYSGIMIFVAAFLKKYKREDLFFILSFVAASLTYICVIATGNVQHDYYQILVIPSISILMALGSVNLINFFEEKHKSLGIGIFIILSAISFYFSWNLIKDYFNINNYSIVLAGEAVDKLTPKNAKVIANYTGDTSFLYQTKRKGWASFEKDLPIMINMGASYLILANPTENDLNLGKTYKIVVTNKNYVIFNLKEKP